MTLIGLCSLRGAPGVTTVAHLVTSGLDGGVLLEADLSGGVIACRYGLGREPGLISLAAERVGSEIDWAKHAQDAGGIPVLVAPDSPDSVASLWRSAERRIATALTSSSTPFVVDLGRLRPDTPLVGELAGLVICVRPVVDHLVALSHQISALRRTVPWVAVLPIGDGPYSSSDIGDSLAVEVLVALPRDQRAADALSGYSPSIGLARSRLVRTAAPLAGLITRHLAGTVQPVGPS